MAEHWRGTLRDLWGFQVTESTLGEGGGRSGVCKERRGEGRGGGRSGVEDEREGEEEDTVGRG